MRKEIIVEKQDLLLMYKTFSELKVKYNKKLTYAISYTKKSISDEANALIESLAPSDSYSEYEAKKNATIDKYAEKDDKGALIVSPQGNAIKINPELAKEFKDVIAELDIEYKSIQEERKVDIEKFNNTLKEVVTVEVEMVEWDDIPEDIDQSLMDALLPIINKEG